MTRQPMVYNGADISSIMSMLTFRRPHESESEKKFIQRFLEPLGVEPDSFGNLWKKIPGIGDDILWSCHTDTVHDKPGIQAIVKTRDQVKLSPRSKANCLGADDSAGVWLMCEMIKHGKPGVYLFHRGEEVGGLGSDYIATHTPEALDGIRAAIALDRKGYHSVITHQGSRCCSDAFAQSLADAIGLDMKPDSTGLFTDTANYIDLIPECTNISVGYFSQHTKKEYLDIYFLCALREKLLTLDTSSLIIERDHTEIEVEFEPFTKCKDFDSYSETELAHMTRFISDYPDVIAAFLQETGVTIDELYQSAEYFKRRDDNIPY